MSAGPRRLAYGVMSERVYAVPGGITLTVDPATLFVEWARDDEPATLAVLLRDADPATVGAAELAARRAVRTLREAALDEAAGPSHRARLRVLAAGLWEEWRSASARHRGPQHPALPGFGD